ncbi:MFS transporter [Streptomyces bacillaris]|uniref:MFS transporter n=1 Tax=Streptomyces bacillaris TaxID=68179 RepID=UPI00335F3C68
MSPAVRKVLDAYVPATRAGRVFALSTLLSAFGTGLFLAGAAVFFTRQAGLTPTQLGTGLALVAAFGLAALLPLGAVADRFGARATLVGALLWRALCFVGLAFVQGPVAFTVVAACQAAAQSITAPVTQALVGTLADEGDRTRMMAVIRTVRNVGFSLGALAAAPLLLADGVWLNRGVLLGNAVAFVAAAVPVARLRLAAAPRPVTVRSPLAAFGAVRDWRYVCLTALNAVLALHMTLLAVGLPLWVTHHSDVPDALVPFLVLVNTVLAIALQVPFARGVTEPRSGARALRRAGLALAVCAALLAVPAGAAPAVAIGAVILSCVALTAGELWQAAGGWELSYAYAPEDRRTTYLSLFGLGTSAQDMAGPLVVALVLGVGSAGWLALAVVFVAAALLAGPVVPLLERRPSAPAPAEAASAAPTPG